MADIQGEPHDPYLTFRDGWRYQAAIDAIRQGAGGSRCRDSGRGTASPALAAAPQRRCKCAPARRGDCEGAPLQIEQIPSSPMSITQQEDFYVN